MIKSRYNTIVFLIILELVFFGVFQLGTIRYWEKPQSDLYDIFYYRSMAYTAPYLSNQEIKPFGYRILPPFIAGIMPFGIDTNFTILMAISLILLVVLTFLFMTYLGISNMTAFFVTVLFMFNRYFHTFFIWDQFQLTDTFTMILVIGMFYCLERDWLKGFSVILFIGSLTKLANLMLIPAAFIFYYYRRKLDFQKSIYLLLAVIPAIAAALSIRVYVQTIGGLGLMQAINTYAIVKLTGPNWLFRTFINHFLPFTFIPLVFYRDTMDFMRRYPHFVVFFLIILGSSFFGDNCERLIAPASFVLYFLLAKIIDDNFRGTENEKNVFSLFLVSAFLVSFHPYMGGLNVPRTMMYFILVLTTIVVTGFGIYNKSKS